MINNMHSENTVDFHLQGLADQNWYVGAVSRVDAEHALHLVNRVKHTPSHLLQLRDTSLAGYRKSRKQTYGPCINYISVMKKNEQGENIARIEGMLHT